MRDGGCEPAERRRRLPSARLIVYVVLTLCLFAREPYEEVLRAPTSGSGIPASRGIAREPVAAVRA
ncbi:transposase domain-containing protein [Streptomyces ficellus]|uniref:transposase domain-containing protein n=1 Tax=Streptomyces ficellus TaxID=1977088 RepID=UPI00338FEDAE